ncbi:hypothetical protein S40288_03195 [Stachybotrys chartarum IBT 40288]|nr:hypothetical protein S40288_03195 [Stachybotrys chartarum IBT 40288]
MAVIAKIEGLSVSVEVAGQVATEHDDPDDGEPNASGVPTKTCYIESKSGAAFAVVARIDTTHKIRLVHDALAVTLYIDGQLVASPVISKDSFMYQSCAHKIDSAHKRELIQERYHQRTFVLAPLQIVENDEEDDAPVSTHLKLLGTIQVHIYHGTQGNAAPYLHDTDIGTGNTHGLTISEKKTKGKALSHSTALSRGFEAAPADTSLTMLCNNTGFYPVRLSAMAPDGSGNIRVFVRWHDQTVFAGEEVKCTITFKNVAASPNSPQPKLPPTSQSDRSRLASPLHNRARAHAGLTPHPPPSSIGRGHRRSALSMNVPPTSSRSRSGSVQWPQPSAGSDGRSGHSHKRSVSIVSIGSTSTVEDYHQRNDHQRNDSVFADSPAGADTRRTSLRHELPDAIGSLEPVLANSYLASLATRNNSSPLLNSSYPPDRFGRLPGTSTAPNTPSLGGPRRSPRTSPNPMPEFRFPAAPPPPTDPELNLQTQPVEGLLSPITPQEHHANIPLRGKDHNSTIPERPAPATRILSSTSVGGGTPRSSGEFYSMSNHSSETLASEYVAQPTRGLGRPSHLRRSSGMVPVQHRAPESLMMGFAQIQGSFSLDGSLVSLGPFEQVKKKGAVGGRGGGVIGLDSTKRDSGLLQSFGWGNISSSIGDLLGGSQLSTIKEMRGAANTKSVPLLSTPQSILFVDLQLAPGESHVFEYTFKLPKGLPPTHRGKSIKIWYSLVIGTQRAGGAKEQQIRTIDVPFRVLASVNSYGEILGHDLLNPYVLLRDEARVSNATDDAKRSTAKHSPAPGATMNDFLVYVDDLITRPRDEMNGTLLSPTAVPSSRRPSAFEDMTSAKEAIHLAIMRSNATAEGQQSPNRFEISRNGQRVGVLMLTRPAYRLGETVTMAVDFTDADIPCYAVHSTLETAEKIDPSIAVRSESSVQRVTRKVYVTSAEASLFSRRIVFTPTIPVSATPEFITSGVSLEWKIRVEFVVPSQESNPPTPGVQRGSHPLLEQISRDEKGGLVLVAAERIACESFDVSVPLRVYGAVGTGLERLERDEVSEEGLAI